MQLLDKYLELQNELLARFGHAKQKHIVQLYDWRMCYWKLGIDWERDVILISETENQPKWIMCNLEYCEPPEKFLFEGDGYTLVLIDNNQVEFAILDNAKRRDDMRRDVIELSTKHSERNLMVNINWVEEE